MFARTFSRTAASAVLAFALILAAGCAEYQPMLEVSPIESQTVVSNSASVTHTFIHDPASKLIVCAQPQPDAGFSQSDEADVSVTLIDMGSDSGENAEGSEEIEMAGRTPTVLMTRELFFRLCEFTRNQQLSKDEALALYQKTLDIVGAGWDKEASQTTVTIGDSVQVQATESTTDGLQATISQQDSASTSSTDSNTISDSISDTISRSESDTRDETDTITDTTTTEGEDSEDTDTY